jgi:hypothetical protein
MTQREVRLAELKKRIAALDQERAAIAAEMITLEQEPIAGEPKAGFAIPRGERGAARVDTLAAMLATALDKPCFSAELNE